MSRQYVSDVQPKHGTPSAMRAGKNSRSIDTARSAGIRPRSAASIRYTPALMVSVVIVSSGPGFSRNRRNAAIGRRFHQSVLARVVHARQVDRRARAARLVEVAHGGEVDIGEDVTVEDEHGSHREVGRVAHAAPRAPRLILDHVAQGETEVSRIAQGLPHVVDAVRAGEDDVGDAVRAKQRELIGEERPVHERHDGFRPCEREGTESRPLPAGQDDRLARVGFPR